MAMSIEGWPVRYLWGALLAALAAVSCAPSPGITRTPSTSPATARGPETAPVPAIVRAPQASQLPACVTPAFAIDLLDAIQAMPEGTLDTQREQLRDWI